MNKSKVVHVHLKDESLTPQDRYYGSIAAIYEDLTSEQVGIKLTSLMATLPKHRAYENKQCSITIGVLQRKRTNRRPPNAPRKGVH